MLQSMRQFSQSIIIYILFGVLIFVFVLSFGVPGTSGCNPMTQDTAGEVEGYEIREAELRAALLRTFGEQLPREEAELTAVQRQVLYNMLTTLLIANAAEEAGLRVSDDELRAYITDWERGNPDATDFRNGGYLRGSRFEKQAYEDFLSYTGASIKEYEKYKRRELLARNYLTLLESSVVVSDAELAAAFAARSGGVNLEYVKLEPRHVEHLFARPDDAAVAAFLASDMDKVKAWFEEHKSEFGRPATVHLKEIVVQKDAKNIVEVGTETNRELPAEERFALVKKAVLEDGASFEDAALRFNESRFDRDNGGDTGVQELDNLSKEYRTALEGKKPGEIVTIDTKYHLILARIEAREDGIDASLDQVQGDIASRLIREARATEQLDKVAQQLFDKAQAGTPLAQALEEVLYAAAPAGTPAPAEEQPAEEQPTDPAPEPTDDAAEPAPTADEAPANEPVARVSVAQTGMFNVHLSSQGGAWSYLPGIGDAPALARDATAAKEVGKVLPRIYPLDDGSRVIATVSELRTGTDEDFASQRQDLINQLQRQKARALLGNWQAVLALNHPEPRTQPYGPWIQKHFDAANTSGDFKVNSKFLGSAPAAP